MFEHRKSRLAPVIVFRRRVFKFSMITLCVFLLTLIGGMSGYHYLAGQNWVDAFMNASMILGGMGPTGELPNPNAKIFAGAYALFCGVVFLLGMGVIIAPVFHRFMHKFHLDMDDKD
jgi:hypothetical protein